MGPPNGRLVIFMIPQGWIERRGAQERGFDSKKFIPTGVARARFDQVARVQDKIRIGISDAVDNRPMDKWVLTRIAKHNETEAILLNTRGGPEAGFSAAIHLVIIHPVVLETPYF